MTAWLDDLNAKRDSAKNEELTAPEGWRVLLTKTDEMLSYIDPNYKVVDFSINWGVLNYNFLTEKTGIEKDIMIAVAQNAEFSSGFICQDCGQSGELCMVGDEVLTMCQEDYNKRKEVADE